MESINLRLRKVLIDERKKTPYSIAKDLDIGTATVDNWIKGKRIKGALKLLTPSPEYINKICDLYHINREWLLTGKGEPYASMEVQEPKINYPSLINQKEEGVPVYDADFAAGIGLFNDNAKAIGHIDMEGYKKCIAFVRIKGDSMFPMFTGGDWVGLEEQKDLKYIQYGHPFAIVLKGGECLIKIIKPNPENPDQLILRSNRRTEFDDIVIDKKDIEKLYKARGPIRDSFY